jgi:regulator of sigma D
MGNCCLSVFDNYIISNQKSNYQIETFNSLKPNRLLLQRALIDNNHKKILIKTISRNPFSIYEKVLRNIKKESVKKLKTSDKLTLLLKRYANCSDSLNELCYRMDSINKQFDNALSKIIEKEETFEEEVEKHKIKIIMQKLYIDGEIKLENYLIIIISFFRI